MKIRMGVTVHGLVQGVAFRHYTCRQALQLGVTGWVRNMPDGTVQGLFEGDEAAVQALVEWCRNGPPAARVESVDVCPGAYSGSFETFRTEH
ncbi:acylphosphatase [Geobacter sp. SVR]|uniref:acylphosphatase n=1 Tax=Geobacter sp. SVR TaxID=2495594 RepID=UPI00143EF941|nr:acylphosphatase [Geobacter sp. SVR]BCS52328.1 acylphosphatase [Geobacter sp. SVR]GCF85013.1 acylphosphatase [Geobacter sp. SVR]